MSSRPILSDYITYSKYANNHPTEPRRETQEEICSRVMGMHRQHLAKYMTPQLAPLVDDIEYALKAKEITGSMRSMQYGGPAILKKHARMYNCWFTYLDRPRAFQEAFWLLLCGGGTGFSLQEHHVRQLPPIQHPTGETITWVVEDSIEGWTDALGAEVASNGIVGETALIPSDERILACKGKRISFDFSKIRAKNSPLSSGNGLAPGPLGLIRALQLIRKLLKKAKNGEKLRPIQVFDILMYASDAVMSGGVRRSASIGLFSATDREMMEAKTGKWGKDNPQRGRANISVVLQRSTTDYATFERIMDFSQMWGEPGVSWVDHLNEGANPCHEIGLWAKHWETGASGWQPCNLSTINAVTIRDEEDFLNRCRLAAAIGTIQASYTDFHYLGPTTVEIAQREALLGVSISGVQDRWDLFKDRKLLEKGAKVVVDTNEAVAALIGIRPAARCTTIKPGGTDSKYLGTSSGIHREHAPQYLQRAEIGEDEPAFKVFQRDAPDMLEKVVQVDSEGHRKESWRAVFALEAINQQETEQNLDPLDMLDIVSHVKKYWVDPGKVVSRCVHPSLSHNVSNTVKVGENDWDAVFEKIYDNRDKLNGVSLLSKSGDVEYVASPWTARYPVGQVPDLVTKACKENTYWETEDELLQKIGVDRTELRKLYTEAWWQKLENYSPQITWSASGDNILQLGETIACSGGKCDL